MYAISTAFFGQRAHGGGRIVRGGAACLAAPVICQRAIDNPLPRHSGRLAMKGFACAACLVLTAFMAVFQINTPAAAFHAKLFGIFRARCRGYAFGAVHKCAWCSRLSPAKLFDCPLKFRSRRFDDGGLPVYYVVHWRLGHGAALAAVYLPIRGLQFSIGPLAGFALDRLTGRAAPHGVMRCYTATRYYYRSSSTWHHERRAAGDRRRNRATGCRDGLSGRAASEASVLALVGLCFAPLPRCVSQRESPKAQARKALAAVTPEMCMSPMLSERLRRALSMVKRRTSGLVAANGDGPPVDLCPTAILRAVSDESEDKLPWRTIY